MVCCWSEVSYNNSIYNTVYPIHYNNYTIIQDEEDTALVLVLMSNTSLLCEVGVKIMFSSSTILWQW